MAEFDWKVTGKVTGRMMWWCMRCKEDVAETTPSCPYCANEELRGRLARLAGERDRLGEIADVFHSERLEGTHCTSAGDKAATDLILMSQERWMRGAKERRR